MLPALVEQGNTVVAIERHDVIKTAAWVLDLGPGGRVNGGEIVAEGTPEKVVAEAGSFTGHYLRETLAKAPVQNEPIEPPKPKLSRSSRAKSRNADADQPDLMAAR